MQTGHKSLMGSIQVPAEWKGIDRNSCFVEYYTKAKSCSLVPYSKTTIYTPTMNNGEVRPYIVSPSTYGVCKGIAKIQATKKNEYVIAETGIDQINKPG